MKLKKDQKIKVCFVSHNIYPLFNKKSRSSFGGAEVQIYLLSKEFAKNKNLDIHIITADYNMNNRTESFQNVKIHISLPKKRKILNYIKGPVNFFITLIRLKPEIIIQRTAGILTGFCAFYCKLFKKKFFIYSISHIREVNGETEKGLIGKFYKFGFNNASWIVAQNKEQIFDLKKRKKKKIKNIKVIKSGYEIKTIDIKNKEFILWVGRAVRWKRPELYLKIAKKFLNEKFVLVCSKRQYPKYWKKIKADTKNIPNIIFIDFIPFYNIDNYFRKAKVFINTSIYEGFPNTFIQALKNKTPIISLNVDPDNFLISNNCGFNCKDDINKMENYLRLLLENHELYDSYSKNSFIYAKNFHDIKKIRKEWIKLINNLIEN